MKLYSHAGTLKPLPPFDFDQSLAFLSDFRPMQNEQKAQNRSLIKAVEINGKTIGFELIGSGNIENPKLYFTAYSASKISEKEVGLIEDRISFFLSLQDDLKDFYQIAKKDKFFKPVIERFYGHKQVKFLTPFEIACWAILTQRTPMVFAHRMKEQIIQKLGGHITIKDAEYRTFPEAARLASVKPAKLPALIPNKKKAEYISEVTKAFSNVEEKWLRTAPFDEVYEWLTGIRGIGEWSANFIMVRGLGRMEKLSSIGPELALDFAKIYEGKDKPASDEAVCEVAEKYANWKGYWAYYLRIYAEFTYVFKKGKKHRCNQ